MEVLWLAKKKKPGETGNGTGWEKIREWRRHKGGTWGKERNLLEQHKHNPNFRHQQKPTDDRRPPLRCLSFPRGTTRSSDFICPFTSGRCTLTNTVCKAQGRVKRKCGKGCFPSPNNSVSIWYLNKQSILVAPLWYLECSLLLFLAVPNPVMWLERMITLT